MRILLVDDHPILLDAVRTQISQDIELMVIGAAGSADEAANELATTEPDLIIVDLQLDGAPGLLAHSETLSHPPKVLILTDCEDPSMVRRALTEGARGYLTKRATGAELVQAVKLIGNGGSYVDPRIAASLIVLSGTRNSDLDKLSGRETSVLKLVAQGYCNKEISAKLQVSIKTVETYRVRAVDKLELRTRSALVRFAQVNGWLAELC